MRAAIELVRILDKEAADCATSTAVRTKMGIVVRQDDEPFGGNVVWHDDKYRQTQLKFLLENGGEPVGLIRIADNISNAGKITIDSSLFEEYRGNLAAMTALKKICRTWGNKIFDQLAWYGDPKATYFGDLPDALQ